MKASFFARLIQYLANEIIVKSLANSAAFQRFAVRSSQQMKELSKNAANTARAISETPSIKEAQKEAGQISKDVRQRAREFADALRDEVARGRRG